MLGWGRGRGSSRIREELDIALVEGAGENVRSRAPEQGKARLQSVHAQTHTHRYLLRQTDTRWTHTPRDTPRQITRDAHRQTDRQTHFQTHRETHRNSDGHRDTQTYPASPLSKFFLDKIHFLSGLSSSPLPLMSVYEALLYARLCSRWQKVV